MSFRLGKTYRKDAIHAREERLLYRLCSWLRPLTPEVKARSARSPILRADYEYRHCLECRPELVRELAHVRQSFASYEDFAKWLADVARGVELHRN